MNTYNLNMPMSWEAFKSMPLDLQQRYLDMMQAKFNVSTVRISEDLFGKSNANLRIYANRVGLKYAEGKRGRHMSAEEQKVWRDWLSGEVADLPDDPGEDFNELIEDPACFENEEYAEEAMELIQEPIFEIKEAPKLNLDELTAVFSGEFDPNKFLHWITALPMPDGQVKIRVEVTRE